jgi:hypothetical protein
MRFFYSLQASFQVFPAYSQQRDDLLATRVDEFLLDPHDVLLGSFNISWLLAVVKCGVLVSYFHSFVPFFGASECSATMQKAKRTKPKNQGAILTQRKPKML